MPALILWNFFKDSLFPKKNPGFLSNRAEEHLQPNYSSSNIYSNERYFLFLKMDCAVMIHSLNQENELGVLQQKQDQENGFHKSKTTLNKGSD